MAKFLIFGGLGFIGTNLSLKLLQNNHHVCAIDNFASNVAQNNLKKFKGIDNFSFIKKDISKKLNIHQRFDYVINLACIASPPQYQKKPIDTLLASSIGVLNIIEYCLNYKPKKIIHASTSEVYGDPNIHPQNEKYFGNVNTVGPRSCYDEGKRYAETALYLYKNKLNISIIRIFNTYGPHMSPNDGRFISNFINQSLNNKNITIYGNGNQTRSICYIDDLIFAIEKLLKIDFFGPLNLGNPNEYRIIEIAKLIIKSTNSKSKLTYKVFPIDDPKRRKPDIKLAKKILNWKPVINANEGLNKTIKYFSNYHAK